MAAFNHLLCPNCAYEGPASEFLGEAAPAPALDPVLKKAQELLAFAQERFATLPAEGDTYHFAAAEHYLTALAEWYKEVKAQIEASPNPDSILALPMLDIVQSLYERVAEAMLRTMRLDFDK